MDSFAVPALVEPPTTGGLGDVVAHNARTNPSGVAVSVRTGDGWRDVTAAAFHDAVVGVAKGLVRQGVQPSDRVGVMARTRYEWTLFDFALWTVGACPVPVYPTSSADQVRWVLADSGAVGCVVENAANAETVGSVRAELPALRAVWTIDDGAVETLTAAGTGVDDAEVERRRATVRPDQPATIVYTSGTTGRPKGCVLTHANLLTEAANTTELLHPVFQEHSRFPASTVLFVPLAHVLGRTVQVACIRAGVRLGHQPSMKQDELREAFRTFRPTFVVGVPYLFQKIHDTARHTAARMGRGASFDRAERVAVGWGEALERRQTHGGRGPGPRLRVAHALYDALVYRRIRAQLGGRMRYAICGGSPLGRRLAAFFAGAGVLVYEGYGLTETTAAATVNPPLAPKLGTVGRPVPGAAVRIAADGEILVAGDRVFAEYWNDPAASRAAFTDGWFATGDVGELDADGYLTVTGRKKEILVTSSGKNVAPEPLEDRIRAHPLVEQCLVVGDDRPFVGALIALDDDALQSWTDVQDAPGTDPRVVEELQRAVDEANTSVSRAESVRAFRVVADGFTEENGLLTPSLKIRRAAAVERYAERIAEMYANPR